MKILLIIFLISFLSYSNSFGNEPTEIVEFINLNAHEIESEDDLCILLEKIGDRRLVLLGEASHGTSEYYKWRAKISQRLIEEKGFNFIAVEGDWPSFYRLNQATRVDSKSDDVLLEAMKTFQRWPEWMWANDETLQLAKWLQKFNIINDNQAGIYGFDVYSLPESLTEVLNYTKQYAPQLHDEINKAYQPFMPYANNPHEYARFTLSGRNFSAEAKSVLDILRKNRDTLIEKNAPAFFNAEQNALIVKNAEHHYRSMTRQNQDSWNIRVDHMKKTVNRLLDKYGPDSKAILWAHNTHIGDARATDMGNRGMRNMGWLTRERYGMQNVFALGFTTHTGQVLAGSRWGSPVQTMNVPHAIQGSIEHIFNLSDKSNFMIFFDENVPQALNNRIGHRAKGVVYNPQNEFGNYVPSIVAQRYDAMIFIEKTTPLNMLFNN